MKCSCCDKKMTKHGFDSKGQQRYRCRFCDKTKTESQIKRFDDNAKEQVDKMFTENISVRGIARILGFSHMTIIRYLRKKQQGLTIS